jgi:hypothetical protein
MARNDPTLPVSLLAGGQVGSAPIWGHQPFISSANIQHDLQPQAFGHGGGGSVRKTKSH